MRKINYNPDHLGTFAYEWGLHKGCREWWYATGILFDENQNMYSYQYTLLHLNMGLIVPKVAMAALTDYQNHRHYYLQDTTMGNKGIHINESEASFEGIASARKEKDGMHISITHKDFALDLIAGYGKGEIWHCDNGKLQMGVPGSKETTLYYSWTNMPSEATLTLNGKQIHLSGKSWFDKQGGTYNMANMHEHWEWFSLRFFDDEEMMLFSFPQNNPPYQDGTYIRKDGSRQRLKEYQIQSTAVTEFAGLKWSNGWSLHLDLKEQDYLIEPIQQGHMNFAYFEELCTVKNKHGNVVGYAFAELLPGVLNQDLLSGKGKSDISMKNLFKRVEL